MGMVSCGYQNCGPSEIEIATHGARDVPMTHCLMSSLGGEALEESYELTRLITESNEVRPSRD